MSVLIDTSVWIDHFRHGNDVLVDLIGKDLALTHPMGCGLVDMALLASTLITSGAELWTLNKRLADLAGRFDIEHRQRLH